MSNLEVLTNLYKDKYVEHTSGDVSLVVSVVNILQDYAQIQSIGMARLYINNHNPKHLEMLSGEIPLVIVNQEEFVRSNYYNIYLNKYYNVPIEFFIEMSTSKCSFEFKELENIIPNIEGYKSYSLDVTVKGEHIVDYGLDDLSKLVPVYLTSDNNDEILGLKAILVLHK